MQPILIAYTFLLFVLLTPGVLVNLPPGCSKYIVLTTHAVIFTAVWHLTHKAVGRMMEGFAAPTGSSCTENRICESNKCRNRRCV
jgi:hypothetical protein